MRTLCAAILVLVAAQHAAAQTLKPVLAGIDSVDAKVSLTWDDKIAGYSEGTIRSRLQTVFELELRQNHIVVTGNAPNILSASLTLLDVGTGAVAYHYDLELRESGLPTRQAYEVVIGALVEAVKAVPKTEAVHTAADSSAQAILLRADSWSRLMTALNTGSPPWLTTWAGASGVGFVGRLKLQDALEAKVREQAQQFVNEYLAAHR